MIKRRLKQWRSLAGPTRTNVSLALLALLVSSTVGAIQPDSPRVTYNFNADWLVKVGDQGRAEDAAFADVGWKKVTLPYAWNEDSAFKVSIGELPVGVAWYVTLPLTPTQGKTVRIELVGAIEDKDEFGLVEVAGKKLSNTSGKNSSGRLEIIEAEIYELLDGGGKK